MILADPHRVYITGVNSFKNGQVVCPPIIRTAMAILIAMMSADGTSTLRNVYSIKRGYAQIAERLNTLGAKITVIQDYTQILTNLHRFQFFKIEDIDIYKPQGVITNETGITRELTSQKQIKGHHE